MSVAVLASVESYIACSEIEIGQGGHIFGGGRASVKAKCERYRVIENVAKIYEKLVICVHGVGSLNRKVASDVSLQGTKK